MHIRKACSFAVWSDLERVPSVQECYDSLCCPKLWVYLTFHTVTLSGNGNFRGFLIVAVNSASQRVGSWSTGTDSKTTCDVSIHIVPVL